MDYGPFAPPQPHATDWLVIQNLLTVSEDFTGWSNANLSFTAGQADPFGGTGAYKITKTGVVATSNQGFTTSQAGPVVFSIWLKADSAVIATISINNALSVTQLAQKFIGIDSVWRRYTIRLANVAAATNLAVSVFPDLPGSTNLDSIIAFGGQVNSGDEATGYVKTAGAPLTVSPAGLRGPRDISAGNDVLAGHDVTAANNVNGQTGSWAVGNKTTNAFAFDDLIQAPGGFAARWTLSNDGTYRLQLYSAYPATVVDTPIEIDVNGKIFISTRAAQGNLCVLENVYGAGQVPSFDAINGLFKPVTVLASGTAAGGDLSGTYPNPTVAKIQGRAVLNAAPADGNVLTWVAANSDWEPVAPTSGPTSLRAVASALLTLSGVFQDVPSASVTLNKAGTWLVIATFEFDMRQDDGQGVGQLLAGGVAQAGLAVASIGTATASDTIIVTATMSWVYAGANGDILKLQGRKLGSGAGSSFILSGSGGNTQITAVFLHP